MKKYLIILLTIITFLIIPKSVNAEVITITQEDFDEVISTPGLTLKGISVDGQIMIESGEYILGSDIDLSAYGFDYISSVGDVSLDLNNHSLTEVSFDVGNSLEIIGNGTVSNSGGIFALINGSLTINNGTFFCGTGCIDSLGNSSLTINGGHFITDSTDSYDCILVGETDGDHNSHTIINGGTFEGKGSALAIYDANSVEINGGTFKGLFGAHFENYNSLSINGGNFIGGIYGLLFKMPNGGSGYSYNNSLSGGSFQGSYDDKYSDYYESEDLGYGAYAVVVEGEYIDASLDMLIESIANSLNNALTENHTFENELDFSSQIKYSGGNPSGEHCEGNWIEDGYDDEGTWVDTSYCDGEMVTDYVYEDGDILTYVYMPSDNSVISTGESNNTYTITTSVTNGVITETSEVNAGEDFIVNYSPDEGYILETVEIDGVSVSFEDYYDSYTFENVNSDHSITVVYVEESIADPDEPTDVEYLIFVYLDNGSIPNEDDYYLGGEEAEYYYTSVIEGEDFTVEYNPNNDFEGGYFYAIKSITIDGVLVDRDEYSSGYTFENVNDHHTIRVVYAEDFNDNGIPDDEEYRITVYIDGGYITTEGFIYEDVAYYTYVSEGEDFTVEYEPGLTYFEGDDHKYNAIKSVRVDGVEVDRDTYSSSYTFENVTSNHGIVIEYSLDENENGIPDEEEAHSITTSITNGYITESQDVEYDGTFEVYYFPSQGYLIDSVTIDRVVVNSETYSSGYTFENVTSDHTIEVICTEYDAGDEVIEITQEDFDTAFENTVCVYDVNSFEYCGSNSVNGVSYYNIDGDSYYYLATGSYRLGSNITMSDGEGISIDSEVNINLNNHNISGGLAGIVSYGTTTIEGSGSISGAIAGVGVSGGSIVINGGTIEGALAGLAITGTPENITLNGGTYRALLNDYGAIGILEDIDSETFIEGINSFLTEGYTFNEEVTYAQTDNDSFGLVTHTQQELLVIPAPETYTITTNVTNGNITQSTEVDEGSNFTVEYSASNGYALKSITVDNNVVNRETYSTSYTFSNVTSDHTISVVYALDENNNNIPDEEETFLVTTSVTNGNITESTEVTYGNNLTVTYSANSGYILKSVTVDGEEVSIETYSNSYTFTNVTSTHTINVVYEEESNTNPEEDNYEIIEGDNQKFKDDDIVITCNGDYNLFVKLLVDGEEVDEENYTVESGSTIVTLKKSYLDTLGSGKHTVTFVYQDGQASATLNIPMTNVPKTLDNIYSYIILLIVSFAMLIIGRKLIKNN